MSSLISFGLFRYQGFYPVSQPTTIHSEPADQVQQQVYREIVLCCCYSVLHFSAVFVLENIVIWLLRSGCWYSNLEVVWLGYARV